MSSKERAGNGSRWVPSMATNAGIPLSRANCICDLCESLGAKERVKISSLSKNPPKLATCTEEVRSQSDILGNNPCRKLKKHSYSSYPASHVQGCP